MSLPHKHRTYRLAAIGGIAALVSLVAFAGQNIVSWRTPTTGDNAPATNQSQITAASNGTQRRSSLLYSGTDAQRRIARTNAIEKSPQIERQVFGGHVQNKQLNASQRMPLQSPLSRWVEDTFDHSGGRENILDRPSLVVKKGVRTAAAETCSSTQFAGLNGQALVNAVTLAPVSCINELFGLSGSLAANTFSEAKMATIAGALGTAAGRYDGTNRDSTLQLILFLRAGYYVQYYDAAVGNYGATLRNAIRPALDAFSNNANFGLVNNVHGEILAEYVTLIDSSSENARYLPVVKRLLDGYRSSYNAYYWMLTAVNNAYTVLFRGHQQNDFRQLVQSDTSIIDTLYGFANRNFSILGSENDYLVSNAGRELGRFLQYSGQLKSLASSRVKALIDRSSVTGVTAPLWIGLGDMVSYYDAANCSYYGMCDFKTKAEAAALPIRHTCSSTLTIRAQSMSASELADTCTIVGGQESYFHNLLKTGRVPVTGDNNAALEMVVFNSSTDYGTYAGAIFGIDTNNGGMYLEGNPSATSNQARFIAYEAEWLQPQRFEIWNLTHEYVHYLDGRFNMFGDFAAAMSQATVWWVEGFAEYMSYSYRNVAYTAAQQEAAKGTYNLSSIYANDYNSGQTRIYNWGYLAVRYMFERKPTQVAEILGYFRPGNYTGYASYMRSIGSSNDTDFRAWLPCVASGCTSANQPPVASFSVVTNGLQATFTDTSTDADGRIASYAWRFGDGATSTGASPTHAYASAGTYTVELTVTDDRGAKAVTTKPVTVTATQSNKPPVAAFTVVTNNLSAQFTDGSSDPDGRIASRVWSFGDGGSATTANPSHTYAAAGNYIVKLTVTDDSGATASTQRTVTVSVGGLPECPGSQVALGRNCVRSNLSVPLRDYVYMYVYVPKGITSLRITAQGGTGNADLYVNSLGSWATREYHNYRSTNAGNSETVVVNYPPEGYLYISLYGATQAQGVSVKVEY